MNYLHLKNTLKDFVVFSLSDVRKIAPDFDRRRLSEWQTKGYIHKLRRGYYTFSGLDRTQEVLFAMANRLYAPSYVSLESALSYYGLIPEGVYQLTSVTSRKTAKFETPLGQFSYQTMKANLLYGYELFEHDGRSYKMAVQEKAVLDYLYFHPNIARAHDFHEWRLNCREFLNGADTQLYRDYAKNFSAQFAIQADTLLDLIQKET